MGAQSAQVQTPQSSQPASKGAGQSASSEPGSGKGGQMSSMSGQPSIGQPNTNGNTSLAPVNPGFGMDQRAIDANPKGYSNFFNRAKQQEFQNPGFTFLAQNDGVTQTNPYPNTIGGFTGGQDGQPLGKGGGGNQGGGKGSGTAKSRLVDFPELKNQVMVGDPNSDPSKSMLQSIQRPNSGPQGPNANY
jgi:hypothetical protein